MEICKLTYSSSMTKIHSRENYKGNKTAQSTHLHGLAGVEKFERKLGYIVNFFFFKPLSVAGGSCQCRAFLRARLAFTLFFVRSFVVVVVLGRLYVCFFVCFFYCIHTYFIIYCDCRGEQADYKQHQWQQHRN